MINIIFNTGLIITRLYIAVVGLGLLLQDDPDPVSGIVFILIAWVMGLLMMPWPVIPDEDQRQQDRNNRP